MARRQPFSYGDYTLEDDPQGANYGLPQAGQYGSQHDQAAAPVAPAPQAAMYQRPAPAPMPAPVQQPPPQRAQDPTRFAPAPLSPQQAPTTAQGGLHSDGAQMAQLRMPPNPQQAFNPANGSMPAMRGIEQGGLAGPQAPAPQANLVQGQVDFSGMGRGQAQVNPMAFKGFNDARALSAGDAQSAKDAFRDIIGSSNIDVRGLSKEEVGAKLAAEVVPLLESRGYPARVKPGEYDIIEVFSNERGWEPIDVVENAGSDAAAWQWGDRPGQGALPPANPGMLQQALGGPSPDELALAQQLGIDTSNPLWRQMFEAYFGQGQDPQLEAQLRQQTGVTYAP